MKRVNIIVKCCSVVNSTFAVVAETLYRDGISAGWSKVFSFKCFCDVAYFVSFHWIEHIYARTICDCLHKFYPFVTDEGNGFVYSRYWIFHAKCVSRLCVVCFFLLLLYKIYMHLIAKNGLFAWIFFKSMKAISRIIFQRLAFHASFFPFRIIILQEHLVECLELWDEPKKPKTTNMQIYSTLNLVIGNCEWKKRENVSRWRQCLPVCRMKCLFV